MLINSIFFGVAIVFYKPGKVHLYKIIRATILALIGGFLLGLIGMGVSLFLILAIVKLNLSRGGMQSVGASLPVLLFSVNLAGTIISIITCAIANVS